LTKIPELPESHVELNMYLIELQLNTIMKSSRSPRLARIVGWVRAVGVDSGHGVKAVEDDRSPSPGGTTAHLGADDHSWRVRRGLNETRGRLAEMAQLPEVRRKSEG
jgi:hypothetical protein